LLISWSWGICLVLLLRELVVTVCLSVDHAIFVL